MEALVEGLTEIMQGIRAASKEDLLQVSLRCPQHGNSLQCPHCYLKRRRLGSRPQSSQRVGMSVRECVTIHMPHDGQRARVL